jgi:hypothetical protein
MVVEEEDGEVGGNPRGAGDGVRELGVFSHVSAPLRVVVTS